jgi:hypothetical protein
MVQLCLKDDRGISDFFSNMRQIAAENKMKFLDRSEDTRADFEAIQNDGGPKLTGPVIQVTVERPDGPGVTATNLGLYPYQVALGFWQGQDKFEAHRLAGSVISRLSTHWTIYRVPNEGSALPLPGCRP